MIGGTCDSKHLRWIFLFLSLRGLLALSSHCLSHAEWRCDGQGDPQRPRFWRRLRWNLPLSGVHVYQSLDFVPVNILDMTLMAMFSTSSTSHNVQQDGNICLDLVVLQFWFLKEVFPHFFSSGSLVSGWMSSLMIGYLWRTGSCCLSTRKKAASFGAPSWKRPTLSKCIFAS